MPRSRDLGRIVSEFFLIVLGVVAALGVDRWVQGIDDSRAEEQYLARVLDDVEANSEIFEGMVTDWEAARDAAEALARALRSGSRPSDAGLWIAIARAGSVNTVPARDGSFRDMEATGNLRLISDPELRSRIVAYFTQDLRFGRPMIEDRLDLRFRTFARERVPPEMDDRALCPRTVPAFSCELTNPPGVGAIWTELMTEPELRHMLNARYADAMNGAGMAHFWLERTEQLQAKILEALDP